MRSDEYEALKKTALQLDTELENKLKLWFRQTDTSINFETITELRAKISSTREALLNTDTDRTQAEICLKHLISQRVVLENATDQITQKLELIGRLNQANDQILLNLISVVKKHGMRFRIDESVSNRILAFADSLNKNV